MNENELFKKYNIVHFDGCRFYLVDLRNQEFTFENTSPYCCVINDVVFYDSSWKFMLYKVAIELDRINPKSEEELLSIANTWGKQEVFGKTEKSNYLPFKGIFINVNHTAIHAMWTIQLLFEKYNMNLDNCKFIIRRQNLAEPKEIRDFEKAQALIGFKDYLQKMQHSEKVIKGLINTIEEVNQKILPRFAKGYYDLFLIENPLYYSSYSGKAIEEIKSRTSANGKMIQFSEYALRQLGEYIKIKHKANKKAFPDYQVL